MTLALMAGADGSWATEENPSMYFGLEVSAGGGTATAVFVNGIPVAAKPAGETGVQSLAIHDLVVPGRNRVDVLIGSAAVAPEAATQSRLRSLPAELFARVRLQADRVTVDGNRYETEVQTLDEHDWHPRAVPGDGLALPQRITLTFQAAADQSPPIWLRARQVTLAEVEPVAKSALERLAGWLAQGNVERFADAMTYRYREAARAYPLGGSADRRRASDIAELRSLLAQPGTAPVPLDTLGIDCRLYADDRLAECLAADGKAALRLLDPGSNKPIYLPVMFSAIDGKLVVVR